MPNPPKSIIKFTCLYCGKDTEGKINRGQRKFCSYDCYIALRRTDTKYKKIDGKWYRSQCVDCDRWIEAYDALRCKDCFKVFNIGENTPRWKGDDVGYDGLHARIKREFPKTDRCALCDLETSKLHLANKSGEYRIGISDWFYLCVNCHFEYDEIWKTGSLTRRANNGSKSDLIGAIWLEEKQKWWSCIVVRGETIRLGYFSTDIEAHEKYMEARARYFTGTKRADLGYSSDVPHVKDLMKEDKQK